MEKKSVGFTLIELLVVLSIISLLMGILLPSLGMVKRKTKSLVCKSNLRNIAMGFHTYLDDNRDIMPPAAQVPSVNITKRPITYYLLPELAEEKKIFKCTADTGGQPKYDTEGTSYEYSMMLGGRKVGKSFLTIRWKFREDEIHVLYDMEAFHNKPGKSDSRNYLYADGHVSDRQDREIPKD
jgi:prepilin-type N-terminal cleavage/methylation domain-containing protein/prepilin-type processing-associated H-X9-DG protein